MGESNRKYLHLLRTDTRFNLKDLPGAIDDRDVWREREREREREKEREKERDSRNSILLM